MSLQTRSVKASAHSTDTCSDSEISDNDSSNKLAFGLAINSNKQDISCKRPTIKVKVEGHAFRMLVDTGSSINVIDEKAYNAIKPKPTLNKTKVYAYGSTEAVKNYGPVSSNDGNPKQAYDSHDVRNERK